jgi:hypothetical protein
MLFLWLIFQSNKKIFAKTENCIILFAESSSISNVCSPNMNNNSSRILLFILFATAFLTFSSSLIINLLTSDVGFNKWLDSYGIETIHLVIGTIAIGFALLSLVYFQFRYTQKTEKEKEILAEGIEPDVKKLFDSLKERYQKRYESKLDGRFEIPLEVSENWHSDKPKTYKFDAEAKISVALEAVRKAFREKDRLLIVGSPGSGKTVLLLKLAGELLGEEYKTDQKLPVIFNLASWSEDYETFEDWLIDVLNSGNGLSREFAKTVLRRNRIIFLLDGLDELARNEDTQIAHEIRAKCLDSLNNCREEFAEMQKTTNRDAPVSAKVEVLDLTKPEILLALQKAQQHTESRVSAEHLEEIIETNEVFLDVLSTPFYFTTALEVFDKHSLDEKDFPTDEEQLKKHLLDRFVESKIAHTPDLTEFEKDTEKIKRWLKWLAQLLEKKQLVSFELAYLQPTDLIKSWHFKLIVGLLGGLIAGLFFGFFGGLSAGLLTGVFGSFVFGSFGNEIKTEDIVKIEFSRRPLIDGLIAGVIGIFFFSLVGVLFFGTVGAVLGGFSGDLYGGMITGTFGGLFGGLFGALISGLVTGLEGLKKINAITNLQTPYQRLYGGFSANLLLAILLMIVILVSSLALNYFITEELISDLRLPQLKVLYALFFAPINYFLITPILLHSYLRLCLSYEDLIPLKFATFLDFAAQSRILEKDGGQWRFRHQNLQEYFASLRLD